MPLGFPARSVAKDIQSKPAKNFFELSSLAIGLIAIAVTIYFAFRAERSKELSVTYISKRALLNADADESSGVRVSFKDQLVSRPHLLSVRIENTGQLPITATDVERPLGFRFEKSNVLTAEVANKSPSDLEVDIQYQARQVEISHKLLNPGDAVGIDILVDGDPVFPNASARISGVSKLREVVVPESPPAVHITALVVAKPLEYVAVISAVLVSGLMLTIAGMLLLDAVKPITQIGEVSKSIANIENRWANEKDDTLWSQVPFQPRVAALLILLKQAPISQWFEDPTALERLVDERIRKEFLADFGVSTKHAAQMIVGAMRAAVPNILASQVAGAFPDSISKQAKNLVASTKFETPSLRTYQQKIISDLNTLANKKYSFIDKSSLMAGTIFLAVSAFALLATLGSLRTVFE